MSTTSTDLEIHTDGDVTTLVVDPVMTLDAFAPGEVRSVDVGIVLTCTGTEHVDPGQTVIAGIDSSSAPLDGAVVSVTDGTVGPAPADTRATDLTAGAAHRWPMYSVSHTYLRRRARALSNGG